LKNPSCALPANLRLPFNRTGKVFSPFHVQRLGYRTANTLPCAHPHIDRAPSPFQSEQTERVIGPISHGRPFLAGLQREHLRAQYAYIVRHEWFECRVTTDMETMVKDMNQCVFHEGKYRKDSKAEPTTHSIQLGHHPR